MSSGLEMLRERLGRISDLEAAAELLSWDQLTMMPDRGGEQRGFQLATLEQLAHEIFVEAETARLLDQADSEVAKGEGTEIDAALVNIVRYDLDRATRIPADLVGQMAQAASDGYASWTDARERNDFLSFLPALERNIDLKMQYIEHFDAAESPYDVLIEDFERGLTSAETSRLFDALKAELRPLVDLIVERSAAVTDDVFNGSFPRKGQQAAGMAILKLLGFDEQSWRIDPTVHPFATSMGISDIRLTTKFVEHDLSDSLMSTIHEFGHGIYEAQIDQQLSRTPLASGCSMTLHESQSRFWENMIGKSEQFWMLVAPILQETFPDQLKGVDHHQMYRSVNRMSPSLIRIEADELTYGFHIIVRFEIERELVEGRLKARDLPEAWNARMKEYLGVDVPSDTLGVLQDVHWSGGSFGYFPTYFLGSVLAAQIWDRMILDLPDTNDLIVHGEFGTIRDWQREHLHWSGRMFTPQETIERAVGEPLKIGPYVQYMKSKVTSLYGE